MTKALHTLVKIVKPRKKRLGRGYGSGKGGHTSTRGTKGQRSRGKISSWFEGGQLALVRRLPKLRGKGRFKPLKPGKVIINLKDLAGFPKGALVTPDSVVAAGLARDKDIREYGIKLLGEGDLNVPLRTNLPTSKAARAKIEKAGGKVE